MIENNAHVLEFEKHETLHFYEETPQTAEIRCLPFAEKQTIQNNQCKDCDSGQMKENDYKLQDRS